MRSSPFPGPFTIFTTVAAGCQAIVAARWRCWLWTLLAPLCAMCAGPAAGGELDDKLAEICKTKDVPGLIAASVGPDGVIESAAAGVRKRGSKDAISTGDQFSLGSNSKSFTATLAAVLVDEGAINWTTTIGEVWPAQPIHSGFKPVTLEQLLAHAGGLQTDLPLTGADWASFFAEKQKPEQERTRMCRLVLTKPPAGTVGKHAYSNLGYVVAAAMLEERGKKPFEQLMKERVFAPLKMTSTEFFSSKTLKLAKGPVLWGHSAAGGAPIKPGDPGSENPTVYAGCGTIRTTIGDWAKYAGWHLKESAGPVLKSDATLRHLHEGVADRGVAGQTYGFGWIQFQSPFGRTLQHAGSNTNQFALVWVMPEAKRATVVITNTGQEQAFGACDAATALLMTRPAFK
jgi:CubicO group peptidase (beta-lactamase class C family)